MDRLGPGLGLGGQRLLPGGLEKRWFLFRTKDEQQTSNLHGITETLACYFFKH